MKISMVVAIAEKSVIGKDNKLIWHLPEDLKYFKRITSGHHVIMGRKTFESIGKPLPNRTNHIITRNKDYKAEGCQVHTSIAEAIEVARRSGESEVFIIGGAEIFRESLPITDRIYNTEVHARFEGDTFFPELKFNEWREVSREDRPKDDKHACAYSFVVLEKINK